MGVNQERNRHEGAAPVRYTVRMKSPLTGGEELIGTGRDLQVARKFATEYNKRYGVHVWIRDIQAQQTVFELPARKERAVAAGGAA